MGTRRHNSKIEIKPKSKIEPIRRYVPSASPGTPSGGSFKEPEDFPDTLGKFWGLKNPKRCEYIIERHSVELCLLTDQQVSKLVRLIKYYDIQGWEQWRDVDSDTGGLSMDDSDGDESPELYRTVQEAVEGNPERALQALAEYLGLRYDRMEEYQERWKTSETRAASAVKRKPGAAMLGPGDQRTKTSRPRPPPALQSIPVMDATLHSGLSLAELTGNVKPQEETTPEPSQVLGYAPPSRHLENADASDGEGSLPNRSSKISSQRSEVSTVLIPTPLLAERSTPPKATIQETASTKERVRGSQGRRHKPENR
jgi:hypothetical protein